MPLPSGEDILRVFFNLINEGKIYDAVNMMSANNLDAKKKDNLGQFNLIVLNQLKFIALRK